MAELDSPVVPTFNRVFELSAWALVTVLLAGLVVHNSLVLTLIHLGVPLVFVKLVSAWKDLAIALLLTAGFIVHRSRLRSVCLLDLILLSFVVLNLMYVVTSPGSLAQRLYGLRQNCVFGAAFGIGRLLPLRHRDAERALVVFVLAVTAAALVGVAEVFLLPTRAWLNLGLPNYTQSLGFHYGGPFGLPENLFINVHGVLVRRVISVYLSPLAMSFSVVLVLPPVVFLVVRRRSPGAIFWGAALSLLFLCLALTLTRAAILVAILVLVTTVIILRAGRRVVFLSAVLAIASLAFLFSPLSSSLTPRVDWELNPVAYVRLLSGMRFVGSLPSSATHSEASAVAAGRSLATVAGSASPVPVPSQSGGAGSLLFSGSDDSLREHLGAVLTGLRTLRAHPFGIGIGQAGSIAPRFGLVGRPGENVYLQLGAELGWIGLILVLLAHGAVVSNLVRWRMLLASEGPVGMYWLMAMVGGIGIFALQAESDILGDFPIVIPLWIAIGWLITIGRQGSTVRLNP